MNLYIGYLHAAGSIAPIQRRKCNVKAVKNNVLFYIEVMSPLPVTLRTLCLLAKRWGRLLQYLSGAPDVKLNLSI